MITDSESLLEMIKQNCYALFYASKELNNNRKTVLEAVKSGGLALKYASFELKNDKEFFSMLFNLCD